MPCVPSSTTFFPLTDWLTGSLPGLLITGCVTGAMISGGRSCPGPGALCFTPRLTLLASVSGAFCGDVCVFVCVRGSLPSYSDFFCSDGGDACFTSVCMCVCGCAGGGAKETELHFRCCLEIREAAVCASVCLWVCELAGP